MTDDYDISPLDLDALRRKHPLLVERFEADAVRESNAQAQHWFAESERLRAALDRAEAVNAALRAALTKACDDLLNDEMSDLEHYHMDGQFREFAKRVRAALADVAGEVKG